LLETGHLDPEAQRAEAAALGRLAQDRLRRGLRAAQRLRRTDVDRLVGLHLDGAERLAGQALGEQDLAQPVLQHARCAHGIDHAPWPQQLGGALHDRHRFRVLGSRGVALDQERAHAEAREHERARQPDRPAADDQDGRFERFPGHAAQPLVPGGSRGR
jgi:hypothetical protein